MTFWLVMLLQSACASKVVLHSSQADFERLLNPKDTGKYESFRQAWPQFEKGYRAIYDGVFPRGVEEAQKQKSERVRALFESLPRLRTPMRAFYVSFEETLGDQLNRFTHKLKDFKVQLDVYLLPSLFTFDVRTMDLKGDRPSLVVGVDQIVASGSDAEVLLAHQIFRMYHLRKIQGQPIWHSLVTPLWLEGFALYMTELINPQKSLAQILGDPALTEVCRSHEQIRTRAQEYVALMRRRLSPGERDQVYADWFLSKGRLRPQRLGACLGLHVMRELAPKFPMETMASWGEDVFIDHVESALQKLAEK